MVKRYFKAAQANKPANIGELILLGFGNIYVAPQFADPEKVNGYGFHKTYFDPECTKEECHCARRSFEDLLAICKTYFPRTTKKHLARLLYNLWLTKKLNIATSFCPDIGAVVFRLHYNNSKWATNFSSIDNGYNTVSDPNKKGKGNYSMNDINKLAGLPRFLTYEQLRAQRAKEAAKQASQLALAC